MKQIPLQNEISSETDIETLVHAEKIRTMYETTPLFIASILALSFLLPNMLWQFVALPKLLTWLALMFLLAISYTFALIMYKRTSPQPYKVSRWATVQVLLALFYGLLWGAAGFVIMSSNMLSGQITLLMNTMFILIAIGVAILITTATYLPVCYSLFIPAMLPFILDGFLNNPEYVLAASIFTLLYVAALAYFAYILHSRATRSLQLRFENIGLVKELTIQKDSAERANAAKTRFLAAASHDLRQPLHAMGLFVSALSERVRGSVTRKLVLQLDASTDALRSLLNSLLDISRLDAGVIQPHIDACSIQQLMDRMENDYSSYAAEKNIKLTILPTRVWVKCDATLLERIVRNLISNAIRYTEHGGVVVCCRRRGTQVRFEVWDTGIGIDQHELDKVFHEFYQVGNPERDRNQGLGLGLAIAQRLARLLELEIEVKSLLGRGSVFSLTLPKCNAVKINDELTNPHNASRLKSALVVVIDDEIAIREATQLMLEDWGCDVVPADSGEAALLALAHSERIPSAIIADYRLSGDHKGIEAIAKLHSEYGSDIPAIIITGDTAPDRIREAEESGYHLLHKPLAPARLRALLSHLLIAK